ncbi:MAG: hypothetical protein V7637_3871 [Mycobacteriales bacterium]
MEWFAAHGRRGVLTALPAAVLMVVASLAVPSAGAAAPTHAARGLVGTIRGNAAGEMSASFPAVTATAVRATILAARDHCRVIELQAAPA